MLKWLKQAAKTLKQETFALYFACKDPKVPWSAKVLAAIIVAYALSPIDLIPDFIPVLGYLDDLVLIPLGIALVMKIIPASVMAECREQAKTAIAAGQKNPTYWLAAVVIVSSWFAFGVFIVHIIASRNR